MYSPLKFAARLSALCVALVLLLLAYPAVAQELEDTEAIDTEALLQQGNAALEQEDYETAIGVFSQLIQAGRTTADAYPILPQAYNGRARALAGVEEYEAAEVDFDEALSLNEQFVPALVARGQMWLDRNAPDRALEDFKAAAEIDRMDIDVQFGLGKSYVMLGAAQSAIRPLTRAVEADPQNAEAFRLRGSANAGILKVDEARADLQESIRLDPEEHETYFVAATVELREENYIGAIGALDLAIAKYEPEPDSDLPFVQGYLTRASAYVELGKTAPTEEVRQLAYQASLDDCNELLVLLGDSPIVTAMRAATLHSRGVALRMLGQLDQAIASFSEAISLNPQLGESFFRRGICYHLVEEDKMAIADFAMAAQINLGDTRPPLWEGFTHAKLQDYYEAVRAYSQAIAIDERFTPAYVNRGLAYMMLGEYEKAVDNFNDAIRIEPMYAPHHFKRGVAYEQLGDFDKAANSFSNAIEFDPQFVIAYQHMARTMDVLGHPELAAEYRRQADELNSTEQNAVEQDAVEQGTM